MLGRKPVRLIVLCIAAVGLLSLIGGFILFYEDKKGGELMLSVSGTCAGGLIALLSSTRGTHNDEDGPVPVTAPAPLPVTETPPPPQAPQQWR